MHLAEQLSEDLKQALRQHDAPRKTAIRMVRAAIQNAEIAKGGSLDDAEILALIGREVKKRRESIELFAKGGREDLVAEETEQLDILAQYLPKQMTPEEIAAAAQQVIAEMGADSLAQMGPVMRALMSNLKGKADGKLVNQVVRQLLAGGK